MTEFEMAIGKFLAAVIGTMIILVGVVLKQMFLGNIDED